MENEEGRVHEVAVRIFSASMSVWLNGGSFPDSDTTALADKAIHAAQLFDQRFSTQYPV